MKKFRLILVAAVMAGLFITSGCVKNEESEGVKQLRMAQATLLQARAQAVVMEAEADAAFTLALAAVQNAMAAWQNAMTRQQEIWNELQEAENEITIAELQLELEVLQSTQEYEIAKAVAEAREALNAAEISLIASIRALEVAIAENDNLLLKEYLGLYMDAMDEVLALRGDIITETAKLARYQIYVDGVGGDLVAEKLREQEKLEHMVALMELYKEKLEVVIGDPSLNDEELTDAVRDVDALYKQMGELDKQQVLLDQAYDAVWTTLMDAQDEYDDARDIVNGHPDIIDDWTNNVGFTDDIDVETFDLEVSGTFFSKATYEEWIADAQDDIAGWQAAIAGATVELNKALAVYQITAAHLADLLEAYEDALQAEADAEHAYNLAEAELSTDPGNLDLIDARDDAWDDYQDAIADRVAAEAEYDAYLNGAYDDAKTEVELWQDTIADHQEWIADANEDIAEWLAEHAIVIAYIAYLQAELDEAELMFDEVRTAYFAAKDAEEAAWDALVDIWDEQNMLWNAIWYAEWYRDVLIDNYDAQLDALDDIIENINDTKAELAELDVTFASWASAIANQEVKIAKLEAELAYWEAVAADYKAMFEGEMENGNGE